MEIEEHTFSQVGSSEVASARCEHVKIFYLADLGWIRSVSPQFAASENSRRGTTRQCTSAQPRPSVGHATITYTPPALCHQRRHHRRHHHRQSHRHRRHGRH